MLRVTLPHDSADRAHPSAPAPRGRRSKPKQAGLGAEEADRELGLGEAAGAVRGDAVGVAVGAVGDHLGERVVDVVRAYAVVAGEAAGEGAVGDEALVEGAALRLGVVVRAEASRQHPEAVGVGAQPGAEGVRGPALEPADAAGRRAGQHDARVPGLAQDLVDPVHAPHRDHVGHRAAADEDDVLRQEEVLGVLDVRHREQRQVADLGGGVRQAVVEPEVIGGVVADGLVQHAQPGCGLAAQLDRVLNVIGDPPRGA